MAAVFIRCDGCGYFRSSPEVVPGVIHAHTFRYCLACDRIRCHHPDEVVRAGRPT
jgi:hypothetical protein